MSVLCGHRTNYSKLPTCSDPQFSGDRAVKARVEAGHVTGVTLLGHDLGFNMANEVVCLNATVQHDTSERYFRTRLEHDNKALGSTRLGTIPELL